MDTNSVKSGSRKSRGSKDGSVKKGSLKSTHTVGSIKRSSLKDEGVRAAKAPVDDGVKVHIYEQVMFERRVLLLCTIVIALAIILWSVAISTDYWFILDGGQGIYISITKRFFLYSHTGIFRICRYAFSNHTGTHKHQPALSQSTPLFPDYNTTDHYAANNVTTLEHSDLWPFITEHNETNYSPAGKKSAIIYHSLYTNYVGICPFSFEYDCIGNQPEKNCFNEICWNHQMFTANRAMDSSMDTTIIDYNRTEGIFSGIALLLMFMGLIFSVYTFKNPRYMFKRTAGGIHFLSTGACLVVLEVLINSIEYERVHIPFTYPAGAKPSYGFSFVLAWIVFLINLICGVLFMLYSRKRKCKKAATDEMGMADEPTIIGR